MNTQASSRAPRGIQSVRAETAPAGEVKALIEQVNQAVAAFKAEHAQQLEDVKKGVDDSLQALKVDRINADISALQAEIDRVNTSIAAAQMGAGQQAVRDPEYTKAFAQFFRGDVQAATQQLNKGADGEGGYLAPSEWDRTITNKLVEVSPMRQLCRVVATSKAGYSKLFNTGGTASGWVGETAARGGTNTNSFASLSYAPCELYANPAATQQMLDDAEINLETWLAAEVQTEFAKQEGKAFVSGDDAAQPKGILTYITGGSNAAKHPLGAIALVNSGEAAKITAEGIIDLIYALPTAFTGNAKFIANRNTLAAIRKLKDGQGNYLWQPSYVAGQPSTLAGYPVVEVPDMPDVAANATPILFGDFAQAYLINDRVGVRVLRDPFSNKPFVSFYTTKRVGGGLLNPEPMRGLKVAA